MRIQMNLRIPSSSDPLVRTGSQLLLLLLLLLLSPKGRSC